MRTIWNGSISFGLVNIPIGLALATQREDVSFRTLHRECGTPIKQKRWCPFHEREVEADELVKGWEVAKGEFVLVEESDLESVALQRSQAIDILRFVKLEDVDPVFFDRTYYLAPSSAEAARRPYVLLLRAMQESGMAAVGKFVLWGKENLCLIRPQGDTLALETLFYAEDVRSKEEIEESVSSTRGARGRARARRPGDREPRRRVEGRGLRQRVPARPQGDARGEARGRGDHQARAGGGDARGRPDGGAPAERRGRAGPARRREDVREDESRPEERLSVAQGAGAQERLTPGKFPQLADACPPTAWSCAWKRYLSILP